MYLNTYYLYGTYHLLRIILTLKHNFVIKKLKASRTDGSYPHIRIVNFGMRKAPWGGQSPRNCGRSVEGGLIAGFVDLETSWRRDI